MHLIIRTCSQILPQGRRCLGAAVRGRSCCRHHLHTRARLHNMARARRLTCIPRLRIPETPLDLACNEAEVNRVLATERIDPDAARTMLWALDLAAAALRAQLLTRIGRPFPTAAKSNEIYYVPVNPALTRSYMQNPTEIVENTREGLQGIQPQRGSVGNRSIPAREGNPSPVCRRRPTGNSML